MPSRVVPASEYCNLPRRTLEWLIPDYLPHPGLLVLVAPPKSGKSYLSLQIAHAVATGGTLLGRTCRRTNVLYLQFDTSETIWRERLSELVNSGISFPDNLYFLHPEDNPTRLNILTHEGNQLLKETLDASKAELIVIDVLREIHNADEQDSTAMKEVGDILMTTFAGKTLILIHHTHKINEFNGVPAPVDAARGSSYIAGKADAVWMIHNHVLHIQSRFRESERMRIATLDNGFFRI